MEQAIVEQITQAKASISARGANLEVAFANSQDLMKREAETILNATQAGQSVIPEIAYSSIADGKVSDADKAAIRHRGAAIIRGVYPKAQAENWNGQIGEYIDQNNYLAKMEEKKGLDQYFSKLDAGKPQIYGLYWSKPQIEARQGLSMAQTKAFLNRLWTVDGPNGREFNPDQDYTYADRTRRRPPGSASLGLSPHMDAGSYERWTDPAYQKIYHAIFEGRIEDYDPWNAAHRTQTKEYPSPAVCSMFRTFQGWTALTPQGPSDGTLRLVPIASGIGYMLLRAFQEDVAQDDLCGAEPGRALRADEAWHPELLESLISIPLVEPGDTVWWHPDIIHSVEDEHNGTDYANVIYVGASPECEKNREYALRQRQCFLEGRSAPDFAAEDYEVDFHNRALFEDLSEIGRAQMGF